MAATLTPAEPETPPPPDPDGVPGLLRPFVDYVARIQARLETKLLAGFLGISLLMLALGIVSLFVVARMGAQVDRLEALHRQADNANQMLYSITAQSHFRTMALLTEDPVWNDKIATAKATFTRLLDDTEASAVGDHDFDELRAIDARYRSAGERVESLIDTGTSEEALDAHIVSEHEISHELEDSLNELIATTDDLVDEQVAGFGGDRRFLRLALGIFSAMSLAGAVALGAIISWTVIGPVRKIDHALDTIASGNFSTRVTVPNRDEFGTLSSNVNRASAQLEDLYGKLQRVNEDLQSKVEEQVALIEHTSELRRYLSPHVADAIVEGQVGLRTSRRAELSIAFVDVRGFTALSEQSEPEEMVTTLNHFLETMTDIVFGYEGTLDKYIGDALMVFFNDPLPQDDHAERAVRMALDMQHELAHMHDRLSSAGFQGITAGVGIATGFVTVGNIGSPARTDYTVIGNHVNLASRLSSDAEPGEILVCERTLALLPDGLVDAEPAGERNLKGVQRPVALYRVTDAREKRHRTPR